MQARWLLKLLGGAVVAAMAGSVPPAAAAPDHRFIALGEAADPPAGYLEMCGRDSAACGGEAPAASGASAPTIACARVDDGLMQPLAGLPVAASTFAAPECGVLADGFATAAIRTQAEPAPGVLGPVAAPPLAPRSAKALVRAVNHAVNRSVRQQSDLVTFGADEFWQRAGTAPDAAGDCEDLALEKQTRLVAAGFPQDRLFLAVVYRSGAGLHTVLIARLDGGDVVLDSLSPRVRPWQHVDFSWLRVQTPGQPLAWRRLG